MYIYVRMNMSMSLCLPLSHSLFENMCLGSVYIHVIYTYIYINTYMSTNIYVYIHICVYIYIWLAMECGDGCDVLCTPYDVCVHANLLASEGCGVLSSHRRQAVLENMFFLKRSLFFENKVFFIYNRPPKQIAISIVFLMVHYIDNSTITHLM